MGKYLSGHTKSEIILSLDPSFKMWSKDIIIRAKDAAVGGGGHPNTVVEPSYKQIFADNTIHDLHFASLD